MLYTGLVKENILRELREQSDRVTEEEVMRIMNIQIYNLSAKTSWQKLRTTATLDFKNDADATDSGIFLPSNLAGIDDIRGVTNDNLRQYVPRNESAIEVEENVFRYYTRPTTADLDSGEDATIIQGATVFTSSSLTTDRTGEYIRFGTELGYYKLSAIKTISTTYYGPDLTNVNFHIRPAGTLKLFIMDSTQRLLTDRSITFHYWTYHPPVYRDQDPILLPSSELIEYMTLAHYLAVLRRSTASDRYRRILYGRDNQGGLLNEVIASNPNFKRFSRPRDTKNQLFTIDKTSLFGKTAEIPYFTSIFKKKET